MKSRLHIKENNALLKILIEQLVEIKAPPLTEQITNHS